MSRPINLDISELSIASWNIDGYKQKIDDPTFLDEIKQHDILFCGEAHANDNSPQIEGYKAKNICFRETKKKGRTPYGISVLIKNNISKYVTFVRATSKMYIWIKIPKSLTGYTIFFIRIFFFELQSIFLPFGPQ